MNLDSIGDDRKPYVSVSEALDDLPSLRAGEVGSDEDHVTRNHRESTVEKYRAADYGDKPHGGQSPRVLHPRHPSYTITVSDGKTPIHYEQPRMLTPREIARLQTFPDDFSFTPPHRGAKCCLVGNAVPVQLAERVGETLLEEIR